MNKRDWLKAISWETISLIITIIIGGIFLSGYKLTMFVIITTVIKIPLLALHNSIWRHFQFNSYYFKK